MYVPDGIEVGTVITASPLLPETVEACDTTELFPTIWTTRLTPDWGVVWFVPITVDSAVTLKVDPAEITEGIVPVVVTVVAGAKSADGIMLEVKYGFFVSIA